MALTAGEQEWQREREREHDVCLDRIEASLAGLHKKVDRLAEEGAVARTEIAWLKWGLRLLFAAVLGVGGVAAQAVL